LSYDKVNKRARFSGRRDCAGQIEIKTPQELVIRSQPRGRSREIRPGGDQLVDALVQGSLPTGRGG
jgi:hypothetical protein